MRALLRLGWREARRHRLRSALVTALIGLPVAVGVAAVILGPAYFGWGGGTTPTTFVEGDADVTVEIIPGVTDPAVASDGTDGEAAADAIEQKLDAIDQAAPGSRAVVVQRVTAWRSLGEDRRDGAGAPVEQLQLQSVDPGRAIAADRSPLVEGRRATAADEVVLTEETATSTGLQVGDRVHLALPRSELEVVGIASYPESCPSCALGLVTPSAFEGALSGSWSRDARQALILVDAPPGADAASLQQQLAGEAGTYSNVADSSAATALAWARLWATVGVVFLLVWTGLIAATGLAVGARRRQRELGLLAASGADPSQLRLAVVAEGALVGLVGAVGGAVLGAAASMAVQRWFGGTLFGVPALRVDLLGATPWMLALGLCGFGAAVVAARAAAAGLGRATPNDLLRGRRRAPRPAPQWFVLGAIALVVGFGLAELVSLDAGGNSGTSFNVRLTATLVTLALGAVTVGLVATVVGASRLLPRLTSRGGLPVRLAGRDLARHGMRVGASCGAVALTLTAAVGMATLFEMDRVTAPKPATESSTTELADGQRYLNVFSTGYELVGDQIVQHDPGNDVTAGLRSDGVDALASAAYFAPAGLQICADLSGSGAACRATFLLVLDDTTMLRPEMRDALDAGLPVTVGQGGSSLQVDGETIESFDLPRALLDGDEPSVDGAVGTWTTSMFDPNAVVVSREGAAALGADPSAAPLGTDVFVVVDRDDVGAEARVRSALVGDGLDVMDPSPPDRIELWWFVAGGIAFVTLVTLMVVLFALALMRIESRGDDAVLAVVGASPSVARRTQAARAATMVLIAAVPAVAVGWGLVRVLSTSSGAAPSHAVPVPWWAMAVVLVGLPALAAVTALVTDRPGRRLRLH